jgi:putative ABC transport system ATP-binding protein
MTPVLTARSLYRFFHAGDDETLALQGVSLCIEPGELVAVTGPSGSGKSTLLQCAAGLDRPTEGRVELAGRSLEGVSERKLAALRRRHVGFVFQSFNLLDALTATQNVELPSRLAGRRLGRGAVRQALADVGLGDRGGHRPSQMSGGQQQRVAIARALVSSPDVIFADEPTGALDRKSGRTVLGLLRAVVDDSGQTLVMVTHDPGAAAWADRVLFLADGRLAGDLVRPTAEQVAERLTALEA